MSHLEYLPVDVLTASDEEVLRAMTIGAKLALRDHKKAGNPVVVWDRENDRIVTVAPEDIPDFPELDSDPRLAEDE